MSQHEFALQLEALNEENLVLLRHIDYLEERLSLYEDVPEIGEPVYYVAGKTPTQDDEACNEWPYNWVNSVWQLTTEGFHSFHGKLRQSRLKSHNLKAQRRYTRERLAQERYAQEHPVFEDAKLNWM